MLAALIQIINAETGTEQNERDAAGAMGREQFEGDNEDGNTSGNRTFAELRWILMIIFDTM